MGAFRSFFSLLLFAATAVAVAREMPKDTSPKFAGTSLPTPPQQASPWKPTEGAPEKWNTAVRALFTQGLADPRGCEYREIEVVAGEGWMGYGGIVKTRGWVLPKTPGAVQDFAVGWNGLVYPVIVVGEVADFRADALGIKDPGKEPSWRLGSSEAGALRGEMQTQANARGPTSNETPLKVCLLLRLGEPALARRVAIERIRAEKERWEPLREQAAQRAGKPVEPREEPVIDEAADPYLDWANQWLWAQWDRAVCAHMRGDDRLSLATLRTLDAARRPVADEANRRGFKRDTIHDESERAAAWPYFNWLREPLPRLLADQERRAKLPRRPTVIAAGIEKYPDQSARIAALIEDLQEVAVRQMGQPGGLDPYTHDPIVAALIREGETAIEPLLAAWKNNGVRLTRAVSFHRDFFPQRYLHTVAGPITAALAAIMQISTDDFDTLPGGVMPATVRAYWKTAKGTTPAERWYRTLADDTADTKAWLLAAQEIVRPGNERNLGDGWSTRAPVPPGTTVAMAGEPLRAKQNPSLSEVWAKRVPQVTPTDFSSGREFFALIDACEFLHRLAKWDAAAARPLLAGHMRLCLQHAEHRGGMATGPGRRLLDWLARFTTLRAGGGDMEALDEFCAWLTTRGNRREGEFFERRSWGGWEAQQNMRVFEPLWRFPDHPAVRATVRQLFEETDSPLVPLLKPGDRMAVLSCLAGTPLCRFPEVRAHLIRVLNDTTPYGTARAGKDGQRMFAGTTSSGAAPDADMQLDTDVSYRVCDLYVAHLSRWEGFLKIEPTWPEAKRDAAVADALRRLREPGDFFEKNSPKKWPGDFSDFGSE